MQKKRIGILTGGGDCPGLNAVIRGVAKSAMTRYGMEVIGFKDGFAGLITNQYLSLTNQSVSGILTLGGTILGTSNKADPFQHLVERNGSKTVVDASDRCVEFYHQHELEALICLGGDGTLSIGGKLAAMGLNIVGVPKTIDKDVVGTDETFGFDSARAMVTDAIDRLHTTADAHHRVMFVEVMGRNAGWLALESCIAGGGDIVLIPEIPFDFSYVAESIQRRTHAGKRFSIVVVSEGAFPKGGEQVFQAVQQGAQAARLGGVSHLIAERVQADTGVECRVAVLGHLQRGGSPSAYDRLLATRFAVKAMELVAEGDYNKMAAVQGGKMTAVPIADVIQKQRTIAADSPLIGAARAVGTSFGAPVG